jgi:acetone carboxylase, gamma subunit
MSDHRPDAILGDLVEGTIETGPLRDLQRRKGTSRFVEIRELEQERVSWPDRILVVLQEHLYVVESKPTPIVKCFCGHEFGDYLRNWKESALVYERDPQDGEVFAPPRGASSDWIVLREFYCPNCGAQLDVEVCPSVYPFVHNFIPNLDALEVIEREKR